MNLVHQHTEETFEVKVAEIEHLHAKIAVLRAALQAAGSQATAIGSHDIGITVDGCYALAHEIHEELDTLINGE